MPRPDEREGESAVPDDETVVRPRREPASSASVTDDAASAIDADTAIRGPVARVPGTRVPVAPVPVDPVSVDRAPVNGLTTPPALVEPIAPATPPIDEVLHPPQPARELVFAYGFRVNSGRAVSLESPVLIGRAPTAPRIVSSIPPVLARVESPHKEVSGTHLELRQEGNVVIATDLRSTNGTTVTPPGRDTQKLRQGESVVVQPGTVIDIGDNNLVEILPLHSRERN